MNSSISLISGTSDGAWLAALQGVVAYDFYHLPFYHRLANTLGEGDPHLLVYTNGAYRILLPLLVRRIEKVPERFDDGQPWYDATSVYGYPGPMASHAKIPAGVLEEFRNHLTGALSDMRVVSLFSRLHPLIGQAPLLTGLGTLVHQGQTISIDLTVPEKIQFAQYRDNHRRDIRKLRDMGAQCIVDTEFRHLDTFVAQYYETMDRVQAREDYRFPDHYFQQFVATREADVLLLACYVGGQIVGSGLFVNCHGILEYHLGGTSLVGQRVGAMKFVLDAARRWGCEHGARVFHLGGGVGSRDDSLANFKIGFSRRSHSFSTWQWIVRQDVYDALQETRTEELFSQNTLPRQSFFPAYRAPALLAEISGRVHPTIDITVSSNGGPSQSPAQNKEPGISPVPKKAGGSMSDGAVKKRLLILGAGGHARVIADAILTRQARGGIYDLVGYLDDNPSLRNRKVLGKPVFGSLADLSRIPHDAVVIGIGDNETRARLFSELKDRGETFATVIHPLATLAHDVKVGRGTVAFAGVIVNTGSVIGENVILNTGCSVDHNCVVGPHAHICPRTSLGGDVTVAEGAFLGINSTIIHGKQIGAWATIGGGAAVIKDIPPHVTAVGVPARVLEPRKENRKPDTRDLILERIESIKEYQ